MRENFISGHFSTSPIAPMAIKNGVHTKRGPWRNLRESYWEKGLSIQVSLIRLLLANGVIGCQKIDNKVQHLPKKCKCPTSPGHANYSYMYLVTFFIMRWTFLVHSPNIGAMQVLTSCHWVFHEMVESRTSIPHHQIKSNRLHVEGYHLSLQHSLGTDRE